MLKYLRIAVTALSLTACMQLVALWVRSYWWCDIISRIDANSQITLLGSNRGTVNFVRGRLPLFPNAQHGWQHRVSEAHHTNDTFKWRFFSRFRISVKLPQWLIVPLFLAVGAAPWIHWSRRFSLRTLLIATALVAVGLGVIVAVR